ncbi:MAG: hypothetical protein CMJ21_03095 [Phycisphaerae bacterium]|nr:hypothetical protein [Phycisphaerae bacterium]
MHLMQNRKSITGNHSRETYQHDMKRTESTTSFEPPEPQQVREYLDAHPPRSPSRWAAWAPLMAVGFVVSIAWQIDAGWANVLPWLVVLGVIVVSEMRVRRVARLTDELAHAQELALQHQWLPTLQLAWRLVPALSGMPQLHGRSVALIAHVFDRLRCYESALAAYDFLLQRMPAEHPAAVHLRVQRAITLMINDQLVDADDALRRLRGDIELLGDAGASAAYRLAQLVQEVLTFHYDHAVACADELLDALRPLGIEAGYGHALVALSWLNVARSQHGADRDATNDQSTSGLSSTAEHAYAQAAKWWSTATLLMPVSQLIDRFAPLRALIDDAHVGPPTMTPVQAQVAGARNHALPA